MKKNKTSKSQSVEYVVYGQITYSDSGQPAMGVRVTAMDADLLFDDMLGQDKTDKKGNYKITYTAAEFRDLFERAPDIYLLLHDLDGRLLTTTKDAVIRDAGLVQEIHVQLPSDDEKPPTHTIPVAGLNVDRWAFEAFTSDNVLFVAKSLYSDKLEKRAVKLLAGLHPSLADDLQQPKLSMSPITRLLYGLVRVKEMDREILMELEDIFADTIAVNPFASHSCTPFDINYQTIGSTAVDTTDSATDIVIPGTTTIVGSTSANGVPNYIERICFWLQRAYQTYTNSPFSLTAPLSGGTITVNVNNASYGNAGNGTINIQHDLSDDLLAWVLVHELMHIFQEEYESNGTAGGWNPGMIEGGAVFAEDTVVDPINRYAAEAAGWGGQGTLAAPHISLQSQSYKLSLFIKYLAEQQSSRVNPGDEPLIGVETYRKLLEKFDSQGYNNSAFESAVHNLPWYQRFYKFSYLDAAKLDETSSETLLGNFWLACYLKDFGINTPDRRFDFMEDEETSLADDIEPISVPAGSIDTLRSVNLQSDVNLGTGGTVTLSSGAGGSVNDFAARFYKVTPDAAVDTLRVNFSASTGFTQPLVQIVLVESGNVVRDILRSDRTTWNRTIANDRSGTKLDHIVIIVAGTDTSGSFTLSVEDVPSAPDVMVSRWHHAAGTHYEIDSFNWAWTWSSPDIWVDTNMDGVGDDIVYFNQNNKLFIRLRNQGNLAASNIQVEFWYQNASGGLSDAAWLPVKNTAGVTQTLTGLTLASQTTDQWSVDWAPAPSGVSKHFCVRAVVTVPGDPNTDNKRCLNNFGNVRSKVKFLDLSWLRRPIWGREDVRVLVVPRLRGRYAVSRADLARINSIPAKLGSEVIDLLRLSRVNVIQRTEMKGKVLKNCGENSKRLTAAREQTRLEQIPDLRGHYPANPLTLPPGLENADLITVVHVIDGAPIGGFTWAIHEEE